VTSARATNAMPIHRLRVPGGDGVAVAAGAGAVLSCTVNSVPQLSQTRCPGAPAWRWRRCSPQRGQKQRLIGTGPRQRRQARQRKPGHAGPGQTTAVHYKDNGDGGACCNLEANGNYHHGLHRRHRAKAGIQHCTVARVGFADAVAEPPAGRNNPHGLCRQQRALALV